MDLVVLKQDLAHERWPVYDDRGSFLGRGRANKRIRGCAIQPALDSVHWAGKRILAFGLVCPWRGESPTHHNMLSALHCKDALDCRHQSHNTDLPGAAAALQAR